MWKCLTAGILPFLCGIVHAQLAFETTSKDVHVPPQDNTALVEFPFKNGGKEAVTLARYESSCSCMDAKVTGGTQGKDGEIRFEPGQNGMVRATFNMNNFSGEVEKVITLYTDKDPNDQPSIKLIAKVHIPVIVDVSPKTVRWDLHEAPTAKIVTVKMQYEKPVKLLSAKSGNDRFALSVKTVEEGKHYEITVTPKDTDTTGIGVIRLETDCPIERHKIQQSFVLIKKPENPVRQ